MMELGDYLPDLPDRVNPGLVKAKNCIPHSASYKSLSTPVVYSDALDARCQGYIATKDLSGNVYNYAGDASKLYMLDNSGTTWADAGTGYTVGSTTIWEFAKWGAEVIAVAAGVAPQVDTIGTGTFAGLSGSPPTAAHIGIVRDFVVLGNLTSNQNRLHWCGINNNTQWTTGTNQSDTQDLQSGGQIQRVIGGEYGVIFCETAIHRMTYVGYPLVFRFDEVEPGRGTPAPGSVVRFGTTVFYLGRDGFYAFNGTRSQNIGTNRVDKTFYADLDTNYYDRISAAIDPINTLVFWSYPGTGNSSGNPNRIIVYNWTTDRWAGPIEYEHELLFQSLTLGINLDQLTSVTGYDLDSLPYPLDSRVWQGGESILSLMDTDHKLANFTGSALDAEFITGERQANPGGRMFISGVKPLFDGSGSATVALGTRNDVNGTVSWSGDTPQNAQTGICPHRSNAFYHRARIRITDGFSHAYGYEPVGAAAGMK